jgi:ZIP family zinc transporter
VLALPGNDRAMWEAVAFGLLASSALVLGGALGSYWQAPTRVTGVLLAFASGTLISALAFELFPEAVHLGGLAPAGWGLLAGAATFVVINTWLDSRVAPPEAVADQAADHRQPQSDSAAATEAAAAARGEVAELPDELAGAAADQRQKVAVASQGVGLALLAAVTLDGVPENLALGVSLAGEQATGGGSLALLVAIFASNFPEALVGAVAMRSQGRSAEYAIGLWAATAALLTLAVVVGRQALAAAEPSALAFPLAFAGGAVLASLADTLMPEAFERGRPLNAFATAAGFFVSFVLADL